MDGVWLLRIDANEQAKLKHTEHVDLVNAYSVGSQNNIQRVDVIG